MKGNTEKCRLMLSTGGSNQIQIGNLLIENSLCEKLLGVKFDYELTFDQHVKSLCKKANIKLKVKACRIPSAHTPPVDLLYARHWYFGACPPENTLFSFHNF